MTVKAKDYEKYRSTHSSARHKKSRKKSKYRLRRLLALTIVLLLVWWINNYTIKINRTSVTSAKLLNPIRITILSDQHATKDGISNDSIITRVEDSEPDAVFVLGDMYTRRSEWELIQIPIDLMTQLVKDGMRVYFVPGDHDTSDLYKETLRDAGVHVMDYKSVTTTLNGNRVQIMGIDNVYYSSSFDLSREFILDDTCYSILMAHIPNYIKFSQFGTDLTLCADTHGGMARFPFLGPAIDGMTMTWFPKLRGLTYYDKGWFGYEGGAMFITSGLGVSPAPVRFNNRPEIVVMDILPEGQEEQQ